MHLGGTFGHEGGCRPERDDQRFACRVKLWNDFVRLSQQLLRAQHVLAAASVHERGRTQLAIARSRIRCA
jgi:hypothetical protein